MLNNVIIMGRLTKDPEVRQTQSGTTVTSFTVAVDRDYNKEDKKTDFVDCVAWRVTGDFVGKYFHKGSMVIVRGRLEGRDWTDKSGNKRRSWEVNAESVYFGESKKSGSDTYTEPTFAEVDDSDDLPF